MSNPQIPDPVDARSLRPKTVALLVSFLDTLSMSVRDKMLEDYFSDLRYGEEDPDYAAVRALSYLNTHLDAAYRHASLLLAGHYQAYAKTLQDFLDKKKQQTMKQINGKQDANKKDQDDQYVRVSDLKAMTVTELLKLFSS